MGKGRARMCDEKRQQPQQEEQRRGRQKKCRGGSPVAPVAGQKCSADAAVTNEKKVRTGHADVLVACEVSLFQTN